MFLADLGAGFQFEVAAGYLYEWLEGGPHWVIQPIHKMPDVAPESGTVSFNYSKPFGSGFAFTARLENSYTGPRYSIYFSDPFEFVGTYRQVPGYDLVNFRTGGQVSRQMERHRFCEQPCQQSCSAGKHVHGE